MFPSPCPMYRTTGIAIRGSCVLLSRPPKRCTRSKHQTEKARAEMQKYPRKAHAAAHSRQCSSWLLTAEYLGRRRSPARQSHKPDLPSVDRKGAPLASRNSQLPAPDLWPTPSARSDYILGSSALV